VTGGHILFSTPGFQICDFLNGLVETFGLLQEHLIGFGQASALLIRQIALALGNLTTSEEHVQMFYTTHVRETDIHFISGNQFTTVSQRNVAGVARQMAGENQW